MSAPPKSSLRSLLEPTDHEAKMARWILENPARVQEHIVAFEGDLAEKDCVFEGEVMPVSLSPLLLDHEHEAHLKSVSERLFSALQRTMSRVGSDEKLSTFLTYEGVPRDWLERDPGFTPAAALTRLDALYDGHRLLFIEFNTDNPGGQGWVDVYQGLYAATELGRRYAPDASRWTEGRPLATQVVRTMRNCFEQWCNAHGETSDDMRIAFIDYRESQVSGDTDQLMEVFAAMGHEALRVDPRDFTFENGQLVAGESAAPINTIHRGLKLNEFVEPIKGYSAPPDVSDLIEAFTSNSVCMVNSARSIVGSEKALLAYLSDPAHHDLFPPEEQRVLRENIPWTRLVVDGETTGVDGGACELRDELINEQEKFVLKPSWGYGGKGVVLGPAESPENWRAHVDKAVSNPGWVAQEFVRVPSRRMPVVDNGEIRLQKRYFNLSPYVFGGTYAGVLGRMSREGVINVSAGGGVVPVFTTDRDLGHEAGSS